MVKTMLTARTVIVATIILAVGELIRAQTPAPGATYLQLGPEAWAVIVGAAVTVGINLEQLRRVRADAKEVKSQLITNTLNNEDWKIRVGLRLQHIEDSLVFLKGHQRRNDVEGL